MFLHSRYAPQVHWGDIASALSNFPCDDIDLASSAFWREWGARWISVGDEYVEAALASSTSAGRARAFRSAAACYHWAEFMDFDDPADKLRLRHSVRDCFLRSLEGSELDLTVDNLTVGPGRDTRVLVWLIMPPRQLRGPGPVPAVIVSNGLDSMTEVEVLALAETYLERGMAAVLFEGPGQGLGVGQAPLRVDIETLVEPIVAWLGNEGRVDTEHLAFVGISFGGYLALRVAQQIPDDFRGVVNLSGGPRIAPFAGLPRRLKDDFRFALMPSDPSQMQNVFDDLALDPRVLADTDVLSIHGALDDIFPLADVQALDQAWGARHELVVYEGEAHVCLNKINLVSLQAADWVARALMPPRAALGSRLTLTHSREDR
jgi:dipeptidyl aminopeptidase/acylaminoacyl peptidase